MDRANEFPASMVEIRKSAVWRRVVAESCFRNIGAFEMVGPCRRQVEEFGVNGLQTGSRSSETSSSENDQKVHVTVDIEVTNSKRTL